MSRGLLFEDHNHNELVDADNDDDGDESNHPNNENNKDNDNDSTGPDDNDSNDNSDDVDHPGNPEEIPIDNQQGDAPASKFHDHDDNNEVTPVVVDDQDVATSGDNTDNDTSAQDPHDEAVNDKEGESQTWSMREKTTT